uniref:Phytanoyl-CoA dioxygenase n=1 Tax=Lotharella globosa TaxID=91324 RepID=A0A7S3ZEG5_9EUKA
MKLHWDTDLFQYFKDLDEGKKRRYQGILAIDNCPESVGGFCAVPGSHQAVREWLQRGNKPYRNKLVPEGDIMHNHVQRFPLRKGDMVIWDFALAHANFENRGKNLRLIQFIRMMPEGTLADNRNPLHVLKDNPDLLRRVESMRLSQKELQMLGLKRH